MAVPSDEQIQKWRDRWKKYPGLVKVIHWILIDERRPPKDRHEGIDRLIRINECFLELPEFEVDVNFDREIGPALDLRGIPFHGKSLQETYFKHAHLEGADLSEAHLEGAYLFRAHLEDANLFRAHLEDANLFRAHLEDAYLSRAHLEDAYLSWAQLEGAYLFEAHLEGAYLFEAHLEGVVLSVAHLEGADFGYAKVGISKTDVTRFANTEFLPTWKTIWRLPSDKRKLWQFISERWFYTNFDNVRIDDADTVQNADLYRYVKDQQFLRRFQERHPFGYKVWKWLAGCGSNIYLIAWWSFVVICLFAMIYSLPWTAPAWMPEWLYTPFLMEPSQAMINPEIYAEKFENLSEPLKWFFVSFDIFTNLGIRTTHPQNDWGVIAVFIETILGFSALGVLIAVAQNKWVRRS